MPAGGTRTSRCAPRSAHRRGASAEPLRRLRRRLRPRASPRPTSSTRTSRRPRSARRAPRLPAGDRRAPLEQAVLRLRRRALARAATRRSPPPPAARLRRAKPRVAAPLQQRGPLDARQVGVPLVRGVGSGVPLHPAGARRPGVRQEQLTLLLREWYMHPNGQLPAYEWALRRREPAGARLGGAPRLPDRAARRRAGRPRVPRERLPQADAQLHLVGEPEGRRGEERLRGRLPRARQHRRLRPLASRCPAAASSSRPTRRAGWGCTA